MEKEKVLILGETIRAGRDIINIKTGERRSEVYEGEELKKYLASQEHEPRQEGENG